MKRVLVTGATGFIGRQCLLPLLTSGYEVHAAVIDALPGEPPGVQWHRVDLLAPDQVTNLIAAVQPSHLLHLAWYAVPGKYWTSPENLPWVQASLGLLQSFGSGVAGRDG
jgi:nucleoside-diphosphate-sugar epimerase